MSEAVDRVAKAIYETWARNRGVADSWDECVRLGHSIVDEARQEARSAIEAIGTAPMNADGIRGRIVKLDGDPERSVFAARTSSGELILKFMNGEQCTIIKLSPDAAMALVHLLILEGVAVRVDV